jgi:hypothetical protein
MAVAVALLVAAQVTLCTFGAYRGKRGPVKIHDCKNPNDPGRMLIR